MSNRQPRPQQPHPHVLLPSFLVRRLLNQPDIDTPVKQRANTDDTSHIPWACSPADAKGSESALKELEKDVDCISDPKESPQAAINPSSVLPMGDTVIQLTPAMYDGVVQQVPAAALKYVDDDDGEEIKVGSSFELFQRLQEPIGVTRMSLFERSSDDRAECSLPKMHAFEIADTPDVVQRWRGIEKQQRLIRSWSAKETKNGELKPSSSNEWPKDDTIVFGVPTPPRAHRGIRMKSTLPSDGNHWASYGDLPGTLCDSPKALPKQESSPTAPQFPLKDAAASSSSAEPKDVATHQPLLEVFEAELAKLMAPADSMIGDNTTTAAPPINTSDRIDTITPIASNILPAHAQPDMIHEPPPMSSSSEAVVQSMKSFFGSVGILATNIMQTNKDLQRSVALAQDDFPRNVERALRASANSIDTLRNTFATAGSQRAESVDQQRNEPLKRESATKPTEEKVENENEQSSSASSQNGLQASEVPRRVDMHLPEFDRYHGKEPSTGRSFQAEKIIGRRYICYGQLTGPVYKQYLVRWSGKSEDDDVWYDLENLKDCGGLVADYDAAHPEGESLNSNRHDKPERFLKEVDAMHIRTAGDRMVTQGHKLRSLSRRNSRSSASKPCVDNMSGYYQPSLVEHASNMLANSANLQKKSNAPVRSLSKKASDDLIDLNFVHLPQDEHTIASNIRLRSSMDDFFRHTTARHEDIGSEQRPRQHENVKGLRHRQSWHPSASTALDTAFNQDQEFSPAAAIAKYPSVSQLLNESVAPYETTKNNSIASGPRRSKSFASRHDQWDGAVAHVDAVQSRASRLSKDHASLPRRAATTRDRRVRFPESARRASSPDRSTAIPSLDLAAAISAAGPWESQRAWGQELRALPSNHASRRDNDVKDCERQLLAMGYAKEECSSAAKASEGKLEMAVDILAEDAAARKAYSVRLGARVPKSRMPAVWSEQDMSSR